MGFMDRIKETANDAVATAQEGLNKGQAKLDQTKSKHDADELFQVLGQAYWAYHAGRAELAQVEALVAGMAERMAPIEESLGPVPFPEPPPTPADEATPPESGHPGPTGWGNS